MPKKQIKDLDDNDVYVNIPFSYKYYLFENGRHFVINRDEIMQIGNENVYVYVIEPRDHHNHIGIIWYKGLNVKCVDIQNSTNLTLNKSYKIVDIYIKQPTDQIGIINDSGKLGAYSARKFIEY